MNFEIIKLLSSIISIAAKILVSFFTRKKKTLYYTIITNPIECNNGIYTIEKYPISKHSNLEHAKYISTIAFWMDKNHALTEYDVDYQCPTIIEIDKKYKIVSAKILSQPQKACFCRPSLKNTESACELCFEYLDSDKGMLFLSILHSAPNSKCLSITPNVNVQNIKQIYANKSKEFHKAGIIYIGVDLFMLAMSCATRWSHSTDGLVTQALYLTVPVATFFCWLFLCRYNSSVPKFIKDIVNNKHDNIK